MQQLHHGTIQLLHDHYWHRKAAFQLQEDTYPHWMIFAVEEGSFRYTLGDGEEQDAVRGDWVICPPETRFGRQVLKPLSFHVVGFQWLQLPAIDPPTGTLSFRDHERLFSAYRYVHQLYALPHEQSLSWRNVLIQELWDGYALQQLLPAASEGEDDHALMLTAKQRLIAHAFQAMSMKVIAEQAGLSPVQFTRRFKAAFGCSPTEYVRQLRLERGKRLLLETSLTVDEIARECGYENGFYFSRVFTRQMQISPSAYRRTHRI